MKIAVQNADRAGLSVAQPCPVPRDPTWGNTCDTDPHADTPRVSRRRRILFFALIVSLIAHAGILLGVTAIMSPIASRPPPDSSVIYLLYTGSSQPLGSPNAGASGTTREAPTHDAKPHQVAKPRHKPKPIPEIFAAVPKARPTPPPVTQVTPIDAAAKSSSTSGHGREDTGAAAGVGAAGGIGVGPGSGSGVFGAAQVAHPPVLISRVMPLYPAKARAHGLDGEVVLRAIIARDGRVEKDIVVAQSSAMFDQPAIDALRQWRFEPGRDHGGNPVRVMLEVPIRFQLR